MISSLSARFFTKFYKKRLLGSQHFKLLFYNKITPFNKTLCTLEKQAVATNAPKSNVISFLKLKKLMEKQSFSPEFTKEQVTLFLQCCGKKSVYEAPNNRIAMLNNLWSLLQNNKYEFDVKHYNVFIEVYTENRILVNSKNFLENMQCQPNDDTYKLLLRNVCEKGDFDQMLFLLNIIKEKEYTIDENTFNCLVLGHTVKNGLDGGESIFEMMKLAEVPITNQTKFSLSRGLIINGNLEELKTAFTKYQIVLDEESFLKATEDLALNDRYLWLPELLKTINEDTFSKHFLTSVQMLCIQLISNQKFDASLFVYKTLVKPSSEFSYGKELIRQMVKTRAPVSTILDVVMDLKNSDLNPSALENATEVALFTEHLELAWILFEKFTYLRPHFFWPVLLSTGRSNGELGILSTLENMSKMGVKADMETLEQYSLKFCNLSEPELFIQKMQDIGYTVKEVFTSICVVLLTQHELEKVENLCHIYDTPIFAERLITPLVANWKNSKNTEAIVNVLQRFCESNPGNRQHLESFLITIFLAVKSPEDLQKLIVTLKGLKDKKLYINPSVGDNLLKITKKRFPNNEQYFNELRDLIDSLQDISITEEPTTLPHPRNMTIEQLECHLLELENKNMETRGVLRKLIQMHSNIGNYTRVNELRGKFIALGYSESPGMKSSIMQNFIHSKDLSAALDLYKEIKMLHPNFRIDSFKVIDLAALLVELGKTEDALDVLNEEARKRGVLGGPGIEENCLNLLKNAKTQTELETLFHTLINCGYCKATNVILGPLVNIHIQNNDIESAVRAYENCTNKYKATPQQLTLLRATLKQREAKLFERVVNATQVVHGKPGAYIAVISALAEEGMKDSLKQFLVKTRPVVKNAVIHNRCDRWVSQKKLLPLTTLADVLKKLSVNILDLPYIQLSIMKVHSLNNDCESALEYWEELRNEGNFIPKEISVVLHNLLVKNKYNVPQNLQVQAQ